MNWKYIGTKFSRESTKYETRLLYKDDRTTGAFMIMKRLGDKNWVRNGPIYPPLFGKELQSMMKVFRRSAILCDPKAIISQGTMPDDVTIDMGDLEPSK